MAQAAVAWLWRRPCAAPTGTNGCPERYSRPPTRQAYSQQRRRSFDGRQHPRQFFEPGAILSIERVSIVQFTEQVVSLLDCLQGERLVPAVSSALDERDPELALGSSVRGVGLVSRTMDRDGSFEPFGPPLFIDRAHPFVAER